MLDRKSSNGRRRLHYATIKMGMPAPGSRFHQIRNWIIPAQTLIAMLRQTTLPEHLTGNRREGVVAAPGYGSSSQLSFLGLLAADSARPFEVLASRIALLYRK